MMKKNLKSNIGVRAFLKKMGLQRDASVLQLDNKLMNSLNAEGKKELEEVWRSRREGGFSSMLDLYLVPKNLRQAALLFSHDYSRTEESMKWVCEKILSLNTKSVIEMGCGCGLLLKYLKTKDPEIEIVGIDQAQNLINIGTKLTGVDLISGNYLNIQPKTSYETIVCDFGFDSQDYEIPNSPHKYIDIGDVSICINCSNAYKKSFSPFIESWRRWGNENSNLVLTGRITNAGIILAILKISNSLSWNLDMSQTTVLWAQNNATKEWENFPGLVFKTNNEDKVEENFQKVIHMLNN